MDKRTKHTVRMFCGSAALATMFILGLGVTTNNEVLISWLALNCVTLVATYLIPTKE